SDRRARHSQRAPQAGSRRGETVCVEKSGSRNRSGQERCRAAPPGPAGQEDRAQRAAVVVSFLAFAAFLRLSEVCAPNFFVNRSTRPSVSISFCRPVKNGWQLEQISRCSSGLVERVFQLAPQAQRTSTSLY